ncbi:MAG TPA: hypothetical protein VGM89_16070, partial [Puia sp.]
QWIGPCRNLLLQRGDSSAEWSRAWKVGLWARLHEGDHANAVLKGYFRDASNIQFFGNHGFPIQVDGPLGVAGAIGEMLVQSNEGYIEWLPALPAEWNEGAVDGLCARGAFRLDGRWSGGRMKEARILSQQGNVCRIYTGAHGTPGSLSRVTLNGKHIPLKQLPGGIVEFPTQKGNLYTLQFN